VFSVNIFFKNFIDALSTGVGFGLTITSSTSIVVPAKGLSSGPEQLQLLLKDFSPYLHLVKA
jgi:hypothetical protein